MYDVSEKFKTASKNPVLCFDLRGYVGSVPFSQENILDGSFTITNQCSDDNNVSIGTVYIGELSATFQNLSLNRYEWYGIDIVPYFGIQLTDGNYEYIPLGIYRISEATFGLSGVAVKAYDYMSLFNIDMVADTTNGLPYDMLQMACTKCGVQLGMQQAEVEALPNGRTELGLYTENDIETWQDFISWLSQALGGFATMDRQGRLIIKTYNQDIVDTIGYEERYNGSTYSNYVTRYTGLSVVNIEDQTTSYYGLEQDDGLTMNLGSNPFLQYGTDQEKNNIRKNILNAISKINYVPFDVKIAGNPAYDLGDVVSFKDGFADDGKLYCINKFVFNFNDNHEIKGVGANPSLASAKSKTDKNLSGLASKAAEKDTIFYNFENSQDIIIENNEKEKIISMHVVARKDAKVEFQAEILCDATIIEDNLSMIAVITYEKDHSELTYYPEETWIKGKHILSLYYVMEIKENTYMDWDVYLTASGGSIVIAASEARATIKGQGLVAGGAEWDGTITIEEEIPLIPIKPVNDITVKKMTDEANAAVQKPVGGSFSEIFTKIPINYSPNIRIRTFDDNFVIQPVMVTKTFSLSDMEPNEYISDDLKVKTEYQAAGKPGEIDTGYRKDIPINQAMFEEINGIEVVVDEISIEG